MEIRIKLKFFVVPLAGPANLFCGENGVVNNTSLPESTLSRRATLSTTTVCVSQLHMGFYVSGSRTWQKTLVIH